MSPRRRPRVDEPELDYWRPPAPTLELVSEELAARGRELEARAPHRPELPPRDPPPLSTLELAWSLGDVWIEPFLARSVELAGGFRPILERAFGMR